jgi:hypothetical protein
MLRTLLAGITLAFTMSATNAADSIQFTCKGDMIEPAGLAWAPKSLNVVFTPADKCRRCQSISAKVASMHRS